MNNNYWGDVEADWAGYSSGIEFEIPYFDIKSKIFLDDEYDDEYEEKVDPPTSDQLDNYAKCFALFLENIDKVIVDIKEEAFERYKRIYAKYYEDENPPLIINDIDAHFNYMKDVLYVRVSDNDIIRILIHYNLDEEHGLEIKIQRNEIVAIGGIAET